MITQDILNHLIL